MQDGHTNDSRYELVPLVRDGNILNNSNDPINLVNLHGPSSTTLTPSQNRSRGPRNVKWHSSGQIVLSLSLMALNTLLFTLWLRQQQERQPFFPIRNTPTLLNSLDIARLRQPNQFVGLAKVLPANRSAFQKTYPTLTSFPILLQTIDHASPEVVSTDDPKRHLTFFGTISPEDRHLIVKPNVTSLIQFKTRDHGFNLCTLQVHLPYQLRRTRNIELPGSKSYANEEGRSRDWLSAEKLVNIAVWKVDAVHPLNPRLLSQKRAPKRLDLLAVLLVDLDKGGTITSNSFQCDDESIQSFEIACSEGGDQCELDIWQDKQNPVVGVVMRQIYTYDPKTQHV